jgi:hypothetical protein
VPDGGEIEELRRRISALENRVGKDEQIRVVELERVLKSGER